SALCPIDGVRRAVSMLRCQWQHVWASYSTTPARLADLRIDLAPGNPADFCLIKPAPDGNIASFRSFVSGEEYEPHTQMT
ncbi:MAG: hypothetical protein N3G20_09505, partial [Verrucomicrobiae bacterium]|nr:hypothetical protein [Verrucomicrobiae bacterium]